MRWVNGYLQIKTFKMAAKLYKQNFVVQTKYEAFYTGGNVEVSEDGSRLCCACNTKIKILDIETGAVIHNIGSEGDEELSAFIYHPNNTIIITASQNGLIRKWNVETAACERTWKSIHNGPISCMAFDRTGTLLATGGSDSTIKVWDVEGQFCTHNLKGAQGVFSVVAFHPSRLLVFGVANDYHIRVWDLQTSRLVASMEGHFSTVTCMRFINDGDRLLTCGRDKVVIYWDLKNYQCLKTIPAFESLESIVVLPEKKIGKLNVEKGEQHFITFGETGTMKIYKLSTGSVVYTDDKFKGKLVTQADYVHKTNTLILVTQDHYILFLNLKDLSLLKQFIGYNDEILDVKFCGVDDTHLVVATNSCDIRIFNLKTSACTLLKGHTDIVLCLSVFKTDPNLIVSSSKDNSIRIWRFYAETENAVCIAVGTGHTQSVSCVTTTELSTEFVVSCSEDTTLKLWKIEGEMCENNPALLQTAFTQIAHTKNINSVALAPNDKYIATGSQDKTAKLWEINGNFIGTFHGHRRGIWCVQFSPVDQVLATSSADSTIKIWTLSDRACVKTFEGHETSVLKLSFIAKGLQLLSSASDGLIKLWTIKTNECIKTFDQHSKEAWALSVNTSETLISSGGGDSTILIWQDVTKEEREEAITKEENTIIQEQKLANLLQAKNFTKALILAITLEMPSRSLNIVREILRCEDGNEKLKSTVDKLREDQLRTLIHFACNWNTNSKNYYEAQNILNIVLRTHEPSEIFAFPDGKTKLEGFTAYTEKHVDRLEKLMQLSTFMDFTWQCMKLKDLPA